MPNRALSTARTLTGTAVVATALGTAVLGVHLATDAATAQAAGTTTSSSSSDDGRARTSPRSAPQQQEGGGLLGFTGFGGLGAPSGGSHSSSHGS
jgi:hypothetical protein